MFVQKQLSKGKDICVVCRLLKKGSTTIDNSQARNGERWIHELGLYRDEDRECDEERERGIFDGLVQWCLLAFMQRDDDK